MVPVCFCPALKTKVGLALLAKRAADPRVCPGNRTHLACPGLSWLDRNSSCHADAFVLRQVHLHV